MASKYSAKDFDFKTASNVAIKDAGGKKALTLNCISLAYRGRSLADAVFKYVTEGNIHPYYADQKAYLVRHKVAHTEKNYKTVYNNLFAIAVYSTVMKYIEDHDLRVRRDNNDNLYLVDKNGKKVR